MRKFIIFRHMPDQLDNTVPGTVAAISLLQEDLPSLRAAQIPLQVIRPVQVQQCFFICLPEEYDPYSFLSEQSVQPAQIITDIMSCIRILTTIIPRSF
jgi:hypothetical protein